MDNLPVPLTKKLKNKLTDSFIPKSASESDKFEMLIRLAGNDVSVRQFAAYLSFLDKSFGRFTPKGILSYSQSHEYELRILEFRRGSLELVLSKLLSNSDAVTALIIVGLLLKYMPGIIRSALSAYRDYEEAKLAKIRRQQIREQIKKDKHLQELNDRQILQLSNLLETLYGLDVRDITKAHRFSSETVIEIKFNVNIMNAPSTGQDGFMKTTPTRAIRF
jgi:hypothetical protein